MKELSVVLQGFLAATQCEAAVWLQARPGDALVPEAWSSPSLRPPPTDELPPASSAVRELIGENGERFLVAPVPGPRRAWLTVGPCRDGPHHDLDAYATFLLPVVAQYTQSSLEVEHAASELAERYEEINLLYTISEILGRTVTLEEAAATTCSVSVTRSWTRIDALRAPTVSEISVRIVAAASSSVTVRPRISLMV